MGKSEKSKKFNFTLIICILIPLLIGGISAFISRNGFKEFADMKKAPLTPPGWVFIVAWTLLYLMMGAASYLIWKEKDKKRAGALGIYVLQLIFNGLWCPMFFGQGWYWIAAIWLIVLVGLVAILVMFAWKIKRRAAMLLLPYMIWNLFALYLNIGTAVMN